MYTDEDDRCRFSFMTGVERKWGPRGRISGLTGIVGREPTIFSRFGPSS